MTTLSPDITPETFEPFHLISGHTGEESEAVIPLMWCVQPETGNWFAERDLLEPQMLITVINDAGEASEEKRYTEMDRYVVPLSRGMEYVRFRRPGTNLVKATIVYCPIENDLSSRRIRKYFKSKDASGKFKVGVIDSEAKIASAFEDESDRSKDIGRRISRHEHATVMTFQVSAGAYGKPSPAFEREYFAKFTDKPVDECARRGRRLLLWPLSPIVVVMSTIAKIIGYVGGKIIGFRGLSFNPVFHPIGMTSGAVYSNVNPGRDGLIWFTKKTTRGHEDKSFLWWPFNLISLLAVWGILTFVANLSRVNPHNHSERLHFYHASWQQTLLWSMELHLLFFVAFVIAAILMAIGSFFLDRWMPEERREAQRKKWAAKQAARAVRKEQKKRGYFSSLLDTMTCDTLPSEISLKALPKDRRAFHLRFQSFKKKVCRPFPQ